MSGRVVIEVDNLSKYYRLGVIGGGTLREDLARWWASVRGKSDPHLKIGETDHGNREGDHLWALRDVSFKVREGEVLGVIGRNGAGKSTLLKILSKITAPTSGRAIIRGRVGSLLEVGTGFHPELTGRENIFLNGAILGMRRAEIARKLDEIVDFSEMPLFIDTPVKRYSSGMTVRLAFAVAAHLDTDILLVDEVLAVGDQAFQEKSLAKMDDVSKSGKTVIFVSHNQGLVSKICSEGLVLMGGHSIYQGDVRTSLIRYTSALRNSGAGHAGTKRGPLSADIEPTQVEINAQSAVECVPVSPLLEIVIRIGLSVSKHLPQLAAKIYIKKAGIHVFTARTDGWLDRVTAGPLVAVSRIPPKLLSPGEYECDAWFYTREFGSWCVVNSVARFEVIPEKGPGYDPTDSMGIVNPDLTPVGFERNAF